ncbi:hypothetical protein B0F90DRAFT_1926343 [Multifurca ochricompacta]|uniref:Glucose-methanol-choline oxidoreductase N-terminal domain-containing protein n=1 Tax=Multifurca ochricompacta TaxID=376703 RepID=A0AAD4M259_9AGAM|nr:hypothetical protein B0F90DRAFT_1926343 [Multifurca ochricompacta]
MSRGLLTLSSVAALAALGVYYYPETLEYLPVVQNLGDRLGALTSSGSSVGGSKAGTTPSRPAALASSAREFIAQEYDYVICSGGVLEAGGYVPPGADPRIDWVVNYGLVFGDPNYDWNLKSVPQEGLDGRVVQETVARVLGGSSMISDVLWQRPSQEEFDVWGTELGNGPTWSFDAIQPYYRKAENWTHPPIKTLPGGQADPALGDAFGTGGPMQISYNNFYPGLIEESVASANSLGARTSSNPETGNATGFFTPARAVDPRSGTRSSSLTGYFEPNANRKNLVVLTGAEATKVLFNDKSKDEKTLRVAEAVEFVSGGEKYKVNAKKEIIVSAGTFKTPQLLELSGIGDRNLLKSFGIETLIDLPGVGENLLDQTYTLIDYVAKKHVKTLDEMRINATFAQEQIALHAETKTGILTYDTAATGSVPLQAVLSKEDIELLSSLIPGPVSGDNSPLQAVQYQLLRKWFDEGEIGWAEFLLLSAGGAGSVPSPDTSYATPIVFHLHPFTRGSVVSLLRMLSSEGLITMMIAHAWVLQSTLTLLILILLPSSTRSISVINSVESSDPQTTTYGQFILITSILADVAFHAITTAWLRKWMHAEPISELLINENAPGEDRVNTFDEWASYARGNAISTFHPIGTAALAPEYLRGVVAPDFKVHRTANLRVVDASVIPLTFSVAPLATVFAIAEKAGDVIKAAGSSTS